MPPVAVVRARDTVVPRASKTAAEGTVVQESPPDTAFRVLDRAAQAAISRATLGVSPAALGGAFFDWWVHLAFSPGKQAELAQQAIAGAADNFAFAAQSAFGSPGDPSERALPHDDRFRAPDWRTFPFNVYAHNFLSIERWWEAATTHVRGVSQRHDDMANFTARQLLDTVAPSNFIVTNPEVLARTRAEFGRQSGARLRELGCGLDASAKRRAAARHGGIQGRGISGGDAWQGRPAHASCGNHPIRARNRPRPPGADRDRAGLDHEILHPRPVAGEFPGQVPHPAGLHRIHGFLEESGR